MKKCVFLGVMMTLLFAVIQNASAGLINYNRLNKNKDVRQENEPVQKPQEKFSAEEETGKPLWTKTLPRVTNNVEARYDANRDDFLEASEVRKFLQAVVDEVDAEGQYSVLNSNILKEYDHNNDEIIDPSEADRILRDIRS